MKRLLTLKKPIGWRLGGVLTSNGRRMFGHFSNINSLKFFEVDFSAGVSIVENTVSGSLSFDRGADDLATVETSPDGFVLETVDDVEIRPYGARRVENISPTADLSSASWSKFDTTISSGVIDPEGGSTAFTMTATGAGSAQVYINSLTIAGQDYAQSWWIRRRTGTSTIRIIRNITGAGLDVTANVTTSWQRLVDIGTQVASPRVGIYILSGDEVDLWHPQIESVDGQAVTAPSEYVSPDSQHGANVDGVAYFNYENGNTVASNVVTEATGSAIAEADLKGALVEIGRTNNCLYSEDLSNAAWVATNITKSSDGVELPDGSTGTAETLTTSAGNGTLIQSITLASAANTFSVYLQRKTGTGNIDITLDNGATWTTKTLTGVGTWDRVDIQGSAAANPDVGVRIVTSGDAIQMWGAQLETGTYPTSYIPTVAGTVTRGEETLSVQDVFPTGNFCVITEVYIDDSTIAQMDAGQYLMESGDSGSDFVRATISNSTLFLPIGGLVLISINKTSFPTAGFYKIALQAIQNGANFDPLIVVNGSTLFSTQQVGTLDHSDEQDVYLGDNNSGTAQGHLFIKNFALYDVSTTPFTEAHLQALTS